MSKSILRPFLATGIVILAAIALCANSFGSEGSGSFRIGYTVTDEVGNFAVNQETYNTYEGFGLSLKRFNYRFDNGLRLAADLNNITLNNRNLAASAYKAGSFRFNLQNNQYRRFYDFEGTQFTRRRNSAISISLFPVKHWKVTAGYRLVSKKGNTSDGLRETIDSSITDYDHRTMNLGLDFFHARGNVSTSYRKLIFDDKVTSSGDNDRDGDEIRVSASARVPGYEKVVLSGGMFQRTDKFDFGDSEIKTILGWGGAKAYFSRQLTVDYRLAFARTDNSSLGHETDNVTNTISLNKSWSGRYGLRIGYESRIADDLIDRTESNGLLFGGWFNYKKKLLVRATVATRDKDVVTGATLIGDESVTNHKVSAKYLYDDNLDLSLQWSGNIRKHEPDLGVRDTLTNPAIESRADYNVLTTAMNVNLPNYGAVRLSHSYYLGQYTNNSAQTGYEFSDHVFTASVRPKTYRSFQLRAEGTYYRSRRDQDIEKFRMSFSAEYGFGSDYVLGVTYRVFNFDDLTIGQSYYTGNIVDMYVSKDIGF